MDRPRRRIWIGIVGAALIIGGVVFWRASFGSEYTVDNWNQRTAELSGDQKSVRVDFTVGRCGNPRSEVRVRESRTEVEVTVVTRTDHIWGGCDDIGISRSLVARFKEPLGPRRLIDGHCRHPEWGTTYSCQPPSQ